MVFIFYGPLFFIFGSFLMDKKRSFTRGQSQIWIQETKSDCVLFVNSCNDFVNSCNVVRLGF